MSVGVYAFNPSTPEAEAGGSLSMRFVWSTKNGPGEQSIGSKGNNLNQKTNKDVIE